MKFIKIAILILFIASIFPIDAFCGDHDFEVDSSHCCVMVCQNCHSIVMSTSSISALQSPQSSKHYSKHSFLYQEPFLDVAGRPPAFLA